MFTKTHLVLMAIGSSAVLLIGAERIAIAQARGEGVAPKLQDMPSSSTVCRRQFHLGHDVESVVDVHAAAAVQWFQDGNPELAKGTLVRPISVMSITRWGEIVVSTSHLLLWRSLDSKEGLGSSVTVLGAGFSPEPGVPPRSQLVLDVRPAVENWGLVKGADDIRVTLTLEPNPLPAKEDPTPAVPPKK